MQMDVTQEKCAELIQAISKVKRKGFRASTSDNLIEELADVEIMIEQMKYMLKDDLEAVIKVKLERQRDRIEKEIEERRISNESSGN
jgi:NTP pyrophosphatase (non-canonical NTP hydrolase)